MERARHSLRPSPARWRAPARWRRSGAGESERLDGEFPREIMPLATEMNALIESNRRIVERARMPGRQSRPFAENADRGAPQRGTGSGGAAFGRDPHAGRGHAVAGAILSEPRPHRRPARNGSRANRCGADAGTADRVMRRLHAERVFHARHRPAGADSRHGTQDTRGDGRQSARKRRSLCVNEVRITVRPAQEGVSGPDAARKHWATIDVEDDGPGLEPDEIAYALRARPAAGRKQAGHRSRPFIVSEIVSEYQGTLSLSRSALGGLKADLVCRWRPDLRKAIEKPGLCDCVSGR